MKMAKEKKSIIEEALLEAQQIDATFKSNAKEILAHTMSSEIEEMVKESLTGSKRKRLKEDEEEELDLNLDSDDDNDLDLDLDSEETEGDEETDEVEGDELDLDLDSEGDDLDVEDEVEADEADDFDLDGLDLGGDNADLDTLGGDEVTATDIDTVDLTGSSDADVISVFKKMGPEDEIEVVNDNGMVTLKDNKSGSEYRIELNGGMGAPSVETSPIGGEEMENELELTENEEDSDDVIYEIEVDEEDEMSDYMDEMSYMNMEDDSYMENDNEAMSNDEDYMSRTLNSGRSFGRPGLPKSRAYKDMTGIYENRTTPQSSKLIKENTNLTNKVASLEIEKNELKENHDKMVDALKQFRKKLQEVAVFNSNLTYAVRLFTENSTTKEEKDEILKRLDSAKSLKESQSIYKQLVKEYTNGKAPIKEAIDEKINKTASSGAQISEQSVFVHPELQNMKKLWGYQYKK